MRFSTLCIVLLWLQAQSRRKLVPGVAAVSNDAVKRNRNRLRKGKSSDGKGKTSSTSTDSSNESSGSSLSTASIISCRSGRSNKSGKSSKRNCRAGGMVSGENLSKDDDVAEFKLTSKTASIDILGDGNHVEFLTFDGHTPGQGPLLNIRLGQKVMVHFQNELQGINTTIHWHGLEPPATSDGSPISQQPVAYNDEYLYEFTHHVAGLTWFHTHINTRENVQRGLYGAVVVHSTEENELLESIPHSCEWEVLILSDLNLEDSRINTEWPADAAARAEIGFNDLEGDILLANGRSNGEHVIVHDVSGNDSNPLCIFVLNVSNTRIMRLFVPGMMMWSVGGDQGKVSRPIPINDVIDETEGGLLLTSGERAEICLVADQSNSATHNFDIMWYDTKRGLHSVTTGNDGGLVVGHVHTDGMREAHVLARIEICGNARPSEVWMPPETLKQPLPIDYNLLNGTIIVTFGHMAPMNNGVVPFFAFSDPPPPLGPLPFDELTPEKAPTVRPYSIHRIRVINLTRMLHNFHLRGFDFQWERTLTFFNMTGPPEMTLPNGGEVHENKDTIMIPARPGAGNGETKTVTDLLVEFSPGLRTKDEILAQGKVASQGQSGGWLFHCHILEHSNLGMMGFVQVVDH